MLGLMTKIRVNHFCFFVCFCREITILEALANRQIVYHYELCRYYHQYQEDFVYDFDCDVLAHHDFVLIVESLEYDYHDVALLLLNRNHFLSLSRCPILNHFLNQSHWLNHNHCRNLNYYLSLNHYQGLNLHLPNHQ